MRLPDPDDFIPDEDEVSEDTLRFCRSLRELHSDKDRKRAMYRAGRYEFRPPSVSTAQWTEDDWILYIDAYNGWKC